jgi:hypothetical protein
MKKLIDGTIIPDEYDVAVNRSLPEEDECRVLLLLIIKQAIEDYRFYSNKNRPEDKEIWNTASAFLFDDSYYMDWAEETIDFKTICGLLGFNAAWLRNRISLSLGTKLSKDGTILSTRGAN